MAKNMENTLSFAANRVETASLSRFVPDTTFVLFFLAMDLFGSFSGTVGLDALLSLVTIGLFAVMPYLLPFEGEKPEFWGWLTGRFSIGVIGAISGLAISASTGVFWPETVRYVPFTLLIISGIFCAFTQLRAIMKVRLAS